MNTSMNIAIVGAGIGGLAAACLLHDAGHRIRVFDRFDAPRPVGSGLVIQPVGQDVLAQIGILDQTVARGAKVIRMFGHDADHRRPVLNVRYDPKGVGTFGLGIHRASLFDALWGAADSRDIPMVQNADVTASAGGFIDFADGNRHGPFDLIVDASGSSSKLSPLIAKPLPYGAIWGTVDWPETSLPRDELRQTYRRADRMIGVLPLGAMPGADTPKAAVFWSLPAGSYDTWREAGLSAWKNDATTLWPEIAPFLDQITDADQMTMARYTHGTLRKPYRGRVVFIGDAAHRASPQLGQGANMALLDAQALTAAITHANGQDPLALYSAARRAHVWCYQAFSRVFTPMYQSDSSILPAIRDRVMYPLSQISPTPAILTALVKGTMIPPLGSLDRR